MSTWVPELWLRAVVAVPRSPLHMLSGLWCCCSSWTHLVTELTARAPHLPAQSNTSGKTVLQPWTMPHRIVLLTAWAGWQKFRPPKESAGGGGGNQVGKFGLIAPTIIMRPPFLLEKDGRGDGGNGQARTSKKAA